MADFKVQRGTTTIASGDADGIVTITAGADYTAPSSAAKAFCRVVGSQWHGVMVGAGGPDHECVTVTYATDITTSITFTRGVAGAAANVTVYWEIVEYTGSVGGANELVVRGTGTVAMDTSTITANTSEITGIVTDADVVVFITGVRTPSTSSACAALFTGKWDTANNYATFDRGAHDSAAATLSYAVVEFTGSNWKVQEPAEHGITNGQTNENISITGVNDLARAFVVPSFRNAQTSEAASRYHTYQAWLSATDNVIVRTGCGTANLSTHVIKVFVIENTQTDGTPMVVEHRSTNMGASDTETADTITEVANVATTSLFGPGSYFTSGNTSYTPSYAGAALNLTTTTNVNLERGSNAETSFNVKYDVVQWPTAAASATHYDVTTLTIGSTVG